MSKGESKNIRLDQDLIEAIETQATVLSKTDSEIIRWAIRRGLGLGVAPVQIKSTLAAKEDLSLLMGEVRKLEDVFRHAKSRLSVPRPISPDDEEGLRQWNEAQTSVEIFFKQSESCLARLEVVSKLLSGLQAEDIQILGDLKKNFEASAERHTNPKFQANLLRIVEWLSKAGL